MLVAMCYMSKLSLLSSQLTGVSRYGKKIWLTEFAKCCTHDKNEVIDFVKVCLMCWEVY